MHIVNETRRTLGIRKDVKNVSDIVLEFSPIAKTLRRLHLHSMNAPT